VRAVPVLPSHAERELDGELQTAHHSARVRRRPLAEQGPGNGWRRLHAGSSSATFHSPNDVAELLHAPRKLFRPRKTEVEGGWGGVTHSLTHIAMFELHAQPPTAGGITNGLSTKQGSS